MASIAQLRFFRKNFADFEKATVSVIASEAPTLANFILQRTNRNGWGTSGSVDANNTTLQISLGDLATIDSLFLIGHNFKSFTIQYKDPVSGGWLAFSPAIAPTNSTDSTSFFSVTAVQTTDILVTILGTQVANSDKILNQFICTTSLGQLAGWPVLNNTKLAVNLTELQTLSGKSAIIQNVGKFSQSLNVTNWSSAADLAIVESLYNSPEGFLYWPCGGNQTQFSSVRQGYRLQDIYLCRCNNEFNPDWADGLYKAGMTIQIDLVEVIT